LWPALLACWRSASDAWTRASQPPSVPPFPLPRLLTRGPPRLGLMPPDFNPSFQTPNWGWWIVLYFFTGGVTGGVYFAAAWLDLLGDRSDRIAMRVGHLVAFPLILLCAIFLIADLGQPVRFWHMIFESERFPLPIFKAYS